MSEWKPTKTQIEAAARSEGWDGSQDIGWWTCQIDLDTGVPDYANDYNAVHRLVQGLNKGQAERFWETLRRMTHDGGMGTHYYQNSDAVQATCAQMFEAVCKAKGWE